MNLKDKLSKIILLVIVAVCLGSYFLIEPFRAWINEIVVLFSTGGVEGVAAFIRSYGIYAVAVSFFLMVFTAVAAPLPAFLITFSNAAIFGWWQGAIISWSSAMVGAVVCFLIARIAGRDVVEALTSRFVILVEGDADRVIVEAVAEALDVDLAALGYIDNGITINIIENGVKTKKMHLELPERIVNIVKCKNPRCITSVEQEIDHVFKLTDKDNGVYRCIYCETQAK